MSYESTAEPIKVGYPMDFKLPDYFPHRPVQMIVATTLVRAFTDAYPLSPRGVNSHLVDRFGEE